MVLSGLRRPHSPLQSPHRRRRQACLAPLSFSRRRKHITQQRRYGPKTRRKLSQWGRAAPRHSEPNRGRADGRRDGAPRPARPPAVDTPAHARQPGRSAALGAALAVAGLGRTHNSALAPASELLSRHGRGLGVHSQPAAVRRRRLCWRLLRGVARERTRTARARTWTWAWARRSMGSRHGSRQ